MMTSSRDKRGNVSQHRRLLVTAMIAGFCMPACSSSTTGGNGGSGGNGTGGAGTGGAASGGTTGAGGTSAKGGTTGSGGSSGTGGTMSAGGSATSGGTVGAGGSMGAGGTTAKGGSTAAGGNSAPGGSTGMGGAGTGGSSGSGIDGGATPAGKSAGCGTTPTLTSSQYNNGTTIPITVNGSQRRYILNVPTNYDNNKPYKFILAVHELNGNDKEMYNQKYYGLLPLSNDTVIFAAPNGVQSSGSPCTGTGTGDSAP